MPVAPGASDTAQVNPGEQPFVPAREEMPAEAAGGGQVLNQIAQTQGQAAHEMVSGLQLEMIREDRVSQAKLLKQYQGVALDKLYSEQHGLLNMPAEQFDANIHKVRDDLVDTAEQALQAAPNDRVRDLLRQSIDGYSNLYEKDIQHAGYVAHKAQQMSEISQSLDMNIKTMGASKNLDSALQVADISKHQIYGYLEPYYGVASKEGLDLYNETMFKGMTSFLDANKQDGNKGGLAIALDNQKVRDILAFRPGTLQSYQESAITMSAVPDGYNIATHFLETEGWDSKQDAYAQALKIAGMNTKLLNGLKRGIDMRWSGFGKYIIDYWKQYQMFPAASRLSKGARKSFLDMMFKTESDPRAIQAMDEIKNNMDEFVKKGAADFPMFDPEFAPGLTLSKRTYYNDIFKRRAGGDNVPANPDEHGRSVAFEAMYQYWPGMTQESVKALPLEVGGTRGFFGIKQGNTLAPWANYVNDVSEWAMKNPKATGVDIQEQAMRIMASYFNQNPQLFNGAAQQSLRVAGFTPQQIEKDTASQAQYMDENSVQDIMANYGL